MTTIQSIDAPSTQTDFDAMNWQQIETRVKRLQVRIAKAVRAGRHGKLNALQWLLTHSFEAKLLAVKRVTENRGKNTPGVDGVLWKTPLQKYKAAQSLGRRGYKPHPLRRIHIPKRNGKKRPLGIPTMIDRAQQALHLLALGPVSEMQANPNAYGFRPKRSTADAIGQCFITLGKRCSPQWVLEADIKSCFDRISHQWLLDNIPMDKQVLRKWLKAGYIDQNTYYPSDEGTPQGGIISPTLLNMTLQGLEEHVRKAVLPGSMVNTIIYADDFVITGVSEQVLQSRVKPAVEDFLSERGLALSEEKTRISHIDDGFDFLGFNVRKYDHKLLIKPAKESIKRFLRSIRRIIKDKKSIAARSIIWLLNPKIQGWVNYYRHVVSRKVFEYVDHQIFLAIWRWCVRRHPRKSRAWVKRKYFRDYSSRHWIFFAPNPSQQQRYRYSDLVKASDMPIKRHIKIRAGATPFDPSYHEYFIRRDRLRRSSPRNIYDL